MLRLVRILYTQKVGVISYSHHFLLPTTVNVGLKTLTEPRDIPSTQTSRPATSHLERLVTDVLQHTLCYGTRNRPLLYSLL